MAVIPTRTKPTYAVASVDNALLLLQMLRDLGELRGKDAASELGISPSTVHRLMSMLVYRGFAIQNESRVYLPGPSVGVGPAATAGARELRALVRPHLDALRDRSRESAYFMVLTGRVVRFLLTSQSSHPLRGGDRQGFVIPAHTSAGGRAILSTLRREEIDELYRGPDLFDGIEMDPPSVHRLYENLSHVRARGYDVGVGRVEKGIVTVSAPIRHTWVRPRAAISLSAPLARQPAVLDPDSIELLLATRDAIEGDLAAANESAGPFE